MLEHPEDIGAELDAGADFTEGGRLLQHRHPVSVARQHVCRGEAADAAAGDEEVKGLGHREAILDRRG